MSVLVVNRSRKFIHRLLDEPKSSVLCNVFISYFSSEFVF